MGITQDEYDNTPALTVDWDLQFDSLEQRIKAKNQERISGG